MEKYRLIILSTRLGMHVDVIFLKEGDVRGPEDFLQSDQSVDVDTDIAVDLPEGFPTGVPLRELRSGGAA